MAVWNIRGVPEELARTVKSTAAARGVTLTELVIGTMGREVTPLLLVEREVGAVGEISPGATVKTSAPKKIAESLAGAGPREVGVPLACPDGGKAQEGEITPIIYGRSGIAPNFNEVIIPNLGKIIPAEDGADYFVAPRKFPGWSEKRWRELAEAEPGGLMACSPELLTEFKELAKTDVGVAETLIRAGVKLDSGKTDMDALRDICAGNTHANHFAHDPDADHAEVDLCGFKSYNEVDGENYICGKEKHPFPKVKHGEWLKV